MRTQAMGAARLDLVGSPVSESGTCGACRASGHVLIRRLQSGIAVTRCTSCGVNALSPAPTPAELSTYYSNYYLTRVSDRQRQGRLVEMHEPILDYLLGHFSDGRSIRFLDYGFGGGAFLRCAARHGHRATGADISPQNVAQLSEIADRDGIQMCLFDLSDETQATKLRGERFDVITLFQVIEHVRSPFELLSSLSSLQEPGGLMYLECPNDASTWGHVKNPAHWLLKSDSWNSLKYPEHLHGFDRRSITALLDGAGYDSLEANDYYYRDGLHQVESEFWWPRLGRDFTVPGLVRSAIPLFDRAMSLLFRAGSGLYALGRKRPGPGASYPRTTGGNA